MKINTNSRKFLLALLIAYGSVFWLNVWHQVSYIHGTISASPLLNWMRDAAIVFLPVMLAVWVGTLLVDRSKSRLSPSAQSILSVLVVGLLTSSVLIAMETNKIFQIGIGRDFALALSVCSTTHPAGLLILKNLLSGLSALQVSRIYLLLQDLSNLVLANFGFTILLALTVDKFEAAVLSISNTRSGNVGLRPQLNRVVNFSLIFALMFGLVSQPLSFVQAQGNNVQAAAPLDPTDSTRIPHYFGPFPNWANSPQVLANAVVAITGDGVGAEATATVDPKTGGITGITVTNPGSGYTAAPAVAIAAPGMTLADPALATAAISLGVVNGITVAETGFGFSAPSVAITGGNPTPGFEATAVASGGVDNVTVLNGGLGYDLNAYMEFTLPDLTGGVQAKGSLMIDANGAIIGVIVDSPGSGYTSAPVVNIFEPTSGLPSVAVASSDFTATIGVSQIDITSGGEGYDSAPTVTITDAGGADLGASAMANVAVKGAVTDITINHAGAGYLTPGIRKFVDTLPGLGPTAANNLGQYIPVAVPDTTTYPGTDYYEIAVVQYSMKFHTDLPATLLRGYVQLSTNVVPGQQVALTNEMIDGSFAPIVGYTGVDTPHYLGPTIVATKDKPVRILFRNLLPTGVEGNLFLPVDTSIMGSGAGPNAMQLDPNGVPMDMHPDNGTVTDMVRNPMCGEIPKPVDCFSENRATLHLHGGISPWISDGTPHQWTTPAGENTDYPLGVSVSNVPDMPEPGPGAMTFFYTNQQSARLMFYHDHAWGITRLNVYAGEAAGYVITDAIEQKLIAPGGALAGLGIGTPWIIQDKTFVPSDAKMAELDPTWQKDRWGGEGSLWAPHVYMPAQNPGDPSGMSSFGRWMYGPWFWPPAKDAKYQPIANPYFDPNCNLDVPATWQYQSDPFCEPALIPSTTNISVGMEAFNDTPVVNGTAYPKTSVDPKSYRFRILNAANDRFWNLSWYVADPRTGTLSEVALNPVELAAAQTDPVVFPTPDKTWSPAGPNWIQIGTEGGFLPAPVVVPAHPTTWITDPTRFDVGNVDQHSLLLAPAERADVIVDFSQFRGKTLILYNDAPAAFPARVPGYDYYTGGPDLSPAGASSTLPGYGPNTRTIMKVTVSNAAPAVAFDRPNTTVDRLGALMTAFAHHADGSGVFEAGQNPIIVGQAAYNSAYGSAFASGGWCSSPSNPSPNCDGYARIAEGAQPTDLFKFDTLSGNKLQIPFEPKAIHDEMNSANFDEWGRMTANLGLEAPGATPLTQNIILYPYANPATEVLDATGMPSSLDVTPISSSADGTQIWKITHNGVDTHPIHFHLYDVQVINRVSWDNIVQPPEPNELGWKDTVRINPLQDTYVAVRPIVPVIPFAVPDSVRPLNPMMPLGARGSQNGPNGIEAGFNNTDALGNPVNPIINTIVNFEWEYVYHCHILSHEEMDMMRPVTVHVARTLPDASVLSGAGGSGAPITLSWTDPTPVNYLDPTTWGNSKNEIGYRVERADGAGAFAPVGKALANATSYVDPAAGLIPAETYHYRIYAFNAAGDSVYSNEVTVVPQFPDAPTALAATAINALQVDLTWTDNATNETNFRVERCTGAGCTDFAALPAGLLGVNAASFSDIMAAPLTTYNYRVFAVNLVGDSLVSSNVATATTPELPPAAASTLTATAVSQTQINLTWLDNSANEDGFTIERALVTGGVPAAFTAIDGVGANIATYSDTAGIFNTTYAYRVTPFNGGGNGLPSDIATATTWDVPPAAPTTLVAIVISQTQVNLTWTDNATNETGFRVERCTGAGCTTFAALPLGMLGANAVSFSDMTAAPFTNYTYQVAAYNAFGESLSNTASVLTPDTVPAAPSGLSAVQNGAQVNLAWTDNANNETSFMLERSVGGGTFSALVTLPASTTSYTDSAVTAGSTYAYRVLAANSGGSSAYSNTASVIVVAAPTNLTATLISLRRINLAWLDNATTETGFVVERAVNGGAFTTLTTIPTRAGTGNVSYRDITVVSGNIYSYRVMAINASGSSAYSNVVIVTDGAAPAAPTNLTDALLGGPLRVSLRWIDNASNETNFMLERSVNGGAFTTLATVPARNGVGNVTYNDAAVLAGNTYSYRVMAVNGVGSSVYSNTFTVDILPPLAPSNFVVTAVVSGNNAILTLTWTDNSNNETSFQIQRATDAAFTAGLNTSTLAANTVFRTETRNRNRTYYYRIRAVNPVGSSAWVNVAPFPIVTP